MTASAQTVNLDLNANLDSDNINARKGDANFSDVQWWMEWYTDTGSTAVTATVGQMKSSGDDLARRTENQAASLEETAAAVEEITVTVQRAAETAR